MLEPGLLELRPDVVEQGAGDPAPVGQSEQHGDEPAERGAEQDEALRSSAAISASTSCQ